MFKDDQLEILNLFSLQYGEAAQLKPIEKELKRLEDLSNAIVQDFAVMRKREEEMRDTNGEYVFIYLNADSGWIKIRRYLMKQYFQPFSF